MDGVTDHFNELSRQWRDQNSVVSKSKPISIVLRTKVSDQVTHTFLLVPNVIYYKNIASLRKREKNREANDRACFTLINITISRKRNCEFLQKLLFTTSTANFLKIFPIISKYNSSFYNFTHQTRLSLR